MPNNFEDIVRRLIDDCWSKGAFESLFKNVADDYIRQVPGSVVLGRDGFRGRIEEVRAGLPGLNSAQTIC